MMWGSWAMQAANWICTTAIKILFTKQKQKQRKTKANRSRIVVIHNYVCERLVAISFCKWLFRFFFIFCFQLRWKRHRPHTRKFVVQWHLQNKYIKWKLSIAYVAHCTRNVHQTSQPSTNQFKLECLEFKFAPNWRVSAVCTSPGHCHCSARLKNDVDDDVDVLSLQESFIKR